MEKLKSLVKKIRNNIVNGQSEVDEITSDDFGSVVQAKKEGNVGCWYNFLGKNETTIIKDATVRKIRNGKDVYFTADGLASLKWKRLFGDPRIVDPAVVQCTMRNFAVVHNGKPSSVTLVHNKTITEGDKTVAPYEVVFDGKSTWYPTEKFDINDINSIRYALRNDEKASAFLDKYFIVTAQEKANYYQYAKQRKQTERQILAKSVAKSR